MALLAPTISRARRIRTKELMIKKLTYSQVKQIYREYMKSDFPASELKPLLMITKSMKKGMYECLGLFEEDKLLGYAFFVINDRDILLDYFAILGEVRNKGYGSTFLAKITEYYKDYDSLLIEVEDPDFSDDEQDTALMNRRIGFYTRNGCIDTGVRVWLFGVDYRVLEVAAIGSHTKSDIAKDYFRIYHRILPRFLYGNVKINKSR